VIDRNRDDRIERDDFLLLQGIGQALAIAETMVRDKKKSVQRDEMKEGRCAYTTEKMWHAQIIQIHTQTRKPAIHTGYCLALCRVQTKDEKYDLP
jgi:hypothetical protein